MKKVLVALDFTPISSALIEYGRQQALQFDAELVLLHIATAVRDLYIGYNLGSQDILGAGMPMYFSDDGVMEVIRQELENEHEQLTKYVGGLKESVRVSAVLRQGPVVETILEEAEKQEADLIILGSHGHNPLRRVILGSVSEGVVADAGCPVMVIPSRCANDANCGEEDQ
jgi:nucleotide-binding universal stress UspA family protein